jgi:hypothetical protein
MRPAILQAANRRLRLQYQVMSRGICGGKEAMGRLNPCGGGVEYLHRGPASHRRRRKGNPVPGGITGPACSWII